VRLAEIERAVALYRESLAESEAAIEAENARARAAEAAEQVVTAREIEQARRRREVDLAIARKAADERLIAAEAERVRAEVEAEASRLLNEAENVLSDDARLNLFRRKLLEHVEGIISASVKPLEKIQDIRIMQLDGLGTDQGGGRGNATDEVINSALRYRVQAPLVDSLLSDIGIDGSNLSRQPGLIREAADMQRIARETGRRENAGEAPDGGGTNPATGDDGDRRGS